MVCSALKEKYRRQRYHAQRRGVVFSLTFEEWVTWWGSDIDNRGRGLGKFQMCRYGDTGAYILGNIYKGTHSENSSLKFKLGFKAKQKYLNEEQISEVNKLLLMGYSTRHTARVVGTNQKTVMRIKHNRY